MATDPPSPSPPSRGRRDRAASLVVAFGFSVGLGVATVAIPLLALDAGYDPPTIGILVAVSAASQLTTRFGLPWLLGRVPDRTLIGLACLLMLASFGLLVVTTVLPAFVVAQLLQGAGRAVFWTSSQTHAVRGDGSPVARLVDLNMVGNVGTLIGPALAGTLAVLGLPVALAAAAAGAAIGLAGSPLLDRLPPFDRRRSAGARDLLRRDGVDVACWASLVGGGWWSMVGSYIPVLLVASGLGPQGVGWLVTASEGASIAALVALRGLPGRRVRLVVRVGGFGTALALVGLAAAPGEVVALLGLLLVGGATSGAVTALGPALASLSASPDEQPDVMAATGVFRAAALLAAPATVAVLVSAIALAPAMAVLGLGLGLPGVVVGRRPGAVSPAGARSSR